MNRHLIILVTLLCSAITSSAQEFFVSPHTERATQLAIGGSNRLDTYLSPEKYRGTELRFISEVTRDSRHQRKDSTLLPLTFGLTHEGEFDLTHNRADNGNEVSGSYDFSYAVMYRWQSKHIGDIDGPGAWSVYAGLMTDFNLGFTYNTRNSSNNPAQGYASLALGANILAQYKFSLWKKLFRVNYEARMPFIGMMFSPNYGQSYYEIFNEGNYDHNIVFTSLATFQLRQQLSLDYVLNQKTSLRLGYLCDIRQAKPNNLKQHHWYNAVTFGVVITK